MRAASLLLAIAIALPLLSACSGEPERRPPPPKKPKPAPAPAEDEKGWPRPIAEVNIPGPGPAKAPPRERPKSKPADPERVAELLADIRQEKAERAAGVRRPGPRPVRPLPEEDLSGLDLEQLVEVLGATIHEVESFGPLEPREDLAAREARLNLLERRLRSVAYRLQLRQTERLREWELQLEKDDRVLADEEARLSKRAFVIVGGQVGVYSPSEELAEVREERRLLRADHERRVRELDQAYRPLVERAAAARAEVGARQREVQRALAEQAGD